ncbi:Nucleus isoform 4 [Hibiscus syriacus]|uniref:Nucleus isoform 4 n=1 Tax=Hibiscus syriacus TaxID=106335 RepID=A0A6A2WMD6_HIBSY|nr:Nucleus isoform 4 [Hibiscus syriacus]
MPGEIPSKFSQLWSTVNGSGHRVRSGRVNGPGRVVTDQTGHFCLPHAQWRRVNSTLMSENSQLDFNESETLTASPPHAPPSTETKDDTGRLKTMQGTRWLKKKRRLVVVKILRACLHAPANYEGLNFQIQALQQSKINLSWDGDEPQRGKILKRKLNDEQLADLELKEFLASDESESDDDENEETTKDQSDKKNKKRDLYRALLQSGDGSDGDGEEDGQEIEVTYNTGLEDISKRILEKKDKEAETVWEAYLRKRREKKKSDMEPTEEPDDFFIEEPSLKKSTKGRKQNEDMEKEAEASRAELELLLTDDKGTDTGPKGYNLKAKKTKGKTQKEVLDEKKIPVVDDDPRFSAFFTSPLYALDPTDPQFKRASLSSIWVVGWLKSTSVVCCGSATYARQISKKRQKGEQEEMVGEDTKIPTDAPGMNEAEREKCDILPSKEKHNLCSMVRSVKMKLKQVQLPSGGKKKQHQVHSKKAKNK